MKRVPMWMLGIATMLASCSQSDELLQTDTSENDEVRVTFSVQTPEMQTRVNVPTEDDERTAKRYICEVYEGDNVNESSTPCDRIEQTGTDFSLLLKKNTNYVFLLWADHGTAADDTEEGNYYDATTLTRVAVQGTATNQCDEIAFYARKAVSVSSTGAIDNITLHHAVAKVCLYETDVIQANSTLTVEYAPAKAFFVAYGGVSYLKENNSLTFSLADGVPTPVADGGKEIARFYVLAPEPEHVYGLNSMSFTLTENATGGGEAKSTRNSINNVPLQANYVTNIRGGFSAYTSTAFSVALDGNWEKEEIDVPIPPFTVDAAGHTIQIAVAGNITKEAVAEAIGSNGTKLKITGPMDPDDFAALTMYFSESDENARVNLDLSEANFTILPECAFCGMANRTPARGLGTITLPMECEEIRCYTFSNVEAERVIAKGVKVIRNATIDCSKIGEIVFGSALTTIEDNAFSWPQTDLTVDLSELTHEVSVEYNRGIGIFSNPTEADNPTAYNRAGTTITVLVANEEMKTFFEKYANGKVEINVKE